jgi:sporulation protein YlmC with PRC-barrel domain
MKRFTVAVILPLLLATTGARAQDAPSDQPATHNEQLVDVSATSGSARASKLIGAKVYQGDSAIGSIEDVLVDLSHGTTTALVLSVGGFLGVGNKLVAVPVTAVKLGSEARFVTELTKDQLTSAPAFNPGNPGQ